MRVGGWLLSAAVAYIAVLTAKSGLWVAPAFMASVTFAAACVAMLRRFRMVAASSAIFALATLAFGSLGIALMFGRLPRWPVAIFGFGSIFWLPIVVLAAAGELLAGSRLAVYARPASAVAAAAFVVMPSMGTDVITPYHDETPSHAAALVLIAGTFLANRKPSRVLRILEPFAIVAAGWCSAYGGRPEWTDQRWLLPYIAVPASCVAAGSVLLRWNATSRPSSSDS